MAKQKRRKFSSAFKAKVAIEAIKNQETMAELSKKFEVNPVMISKWKNEFLEKVDSVFDSKGKSSDQDQDVDVEKLYAQIGQLKVENDFLKKSCKKLGI